MLKEIRFTDKVVIFTLFLAFLSYPFFIKFLFYSFYQVLMITFTSLSIFIMYSRKNIVLTRNQLIFIGLYIIYFMFVLVASLNFLEEQIYYVLMNQIIKIVFFIGLFIFLTDTLNYKILTIYSNMILVFSILGIILWVLISINIVHPYGDLVMSNDFKNSDVRQNFIIGFSWYSVSQGNFNFSRLQSYSDEPATFALACIPALFYFFYLKKRFELIVVSTAYFLTFSLGLYLPLLLYVVIYKRSIVNIIKAIFMTFVTCIVLYLVLPEQILNVLFNYLSSKFTSSNGDMSSVGERISDVIIVLDLIKENIFGYGIIGNKMEQLGSMAIGPISVLIKAGLFGGVLHFLLFSLLFLFSIQKIFNHRNNSLLTNVFLSTYFIFYIASYSRGEIDITYFQLWIIASVVNSLKIQLKN